MASENRGLVSLFDGKTLTGWHAVPRVHPSMPPERYSHAEATSGRWEVIDGAIVGSQAVTGLGGICLATNAMPTSS